MIDKFKSSGGLDAANQKLVNVADGDQAQDGVNVRVLDKKNTVQSHSTSRTYELGFIVEYNGQLWKCTTPVSTPGVFDGASWTALAGRENWIRLTASYTAGVMDSLYVDAASAITVTLPATPKSGDYVTIIDGAGLASQRPITVARNGTTINGAAADVTLNEDDVRCVFVYLGGTWKTLYTKTLRSKFTGSSAFTASSGLVYLIDVTANFTVTLPVSPKVGDVVRLVDYNAGLGVNTITVNGNGKQINGSTNLLFTQKKGNLELTYNGTQWIAIIGSNNGLIADKNLSDVEDKAAARSNLQLGTAAQQNMGTAASEIRTNAQNDIAFQAKDATLTALAALVTAADKLVYASGTDQFAQTDFPAQARALLAAATQAQQREVLALGDAATRTVGTSNTNVMEVGAFGLGSTALVISDPDLITKNGWYSCAGGAPHAPSVTYLSSILHSEHATSQGATQLAVDSNSSIYLRTKSSGGTWGAWSSISAGSFGTAATRNVGTSATNVMEVGAFGLGVAANPNALDSTTINNTSLATGFYQAGPSVVPGQTSGSLILVMTNGSASTQIAFSAATSSIVSTRTYTGSAWGSWGAIHTNATIASAVAAGVGTMIGTNGSQTQPMGVGAFGLGVDIPTTTITDCNTATKNGWFIVSDTATNRPTMGTNPSGLLVITDGISTRRTQILTDASQSSGNGPRIWVRQHDGSSWSAWTKLVFFDTIAPNWINATYTNGWTDFSTTYDSFGYRLEGNRVHWRGVVKNASAVTTAIATMPLGYRPLKTKMFSIVTGTTAPTCITVNTNGLVSLFAYATAGAAVPLDGISYEID